MPKCSCIEYNYGDAYCPDCKLVHVAGGCCHYEHVVGPQKARRRPVSKPGPQRKTRPRRSANEDNGRIVDGQYILPLPKKSRSNWKLPPVPMRRPYPLMAPRVLESPVPMAPRPPAEVIDRVERVGGIKVPITTRRRGYGRMRPVVTVTPEFELRLMSKTPPKTYSSLKVPTTAKSGHIRMQPNYGFSRQKIPDNSPVGGNTQWMLPNFGRGQPASKLKKYGVMAPNYGGEPYFRYDLTPETRPIMR